MSQWFQKNRELALTIAGLVILLLFRVAYYPVWLRWTTHSKKDTVLKEQAISSTNTPTAARTNIVNVYRNDWFYDICDQGCEIVNMYWWAQRLQNGKYRCQPVLDMYFSTYKLETDTIAPNNSLMLCLANGDTIVKKANDWYFPWSIGSTRRHTDCHAQRRSFYTPFTAKETALLRSVNIVEIHVESKHDLLIKEVSLETGDLLKQRFIFITDTFGKRIK